MPQIQRKGDRNNAGGAIIQGESSVRANGIPVAVTNAPVTNHPNHRPPHTNARTQNTQTRVRVNGKPVVMTNDRDICGHVRQGGSPNVRVGK